MTIFADANAGQVDRQGRDQGAQAPALGRRIPLAVDEVKGLQAGNPVDEALLQVAPEAGRVRNGQPHVFVQVESRYPAPIHGLGHQGAQHLKLAGAGGQDNVGLAAGCDGPVDLFGGVAAGRLAHSGFIGKNMQVQCVPPEVVYDDFTFFILPTASRSGKDKKSDFLKIK